MGISSLIRPIIMIKEQEELNNRFRTLTEFGKAKMIKEGQNEFRRQVESDRAEK
jgi:hypothetical protein